jgi:A/G-specific adenine glycosylase
MAQIRDFKDKIWDFYWEEGRKLPWREYITPYRVFISELMLQQTQVSRVLIKFPLFLRTFPDFKSLATASNHKVLSQWQGMGKLESVYCKNQPDHD